MSRASRGGGDAAIVGLMLIFFVLAAIVFALVFGAAHHNRTVETYSRLAKQYGGTCEPGGLFQRPTVRFRHAGSSVVLDVCSTGGEHRTYYTQLHFRGTQPTVRCEVYPEGMWSRVGKLLGMEDVRIGSPDFDRQYVIKGDDRAALRDLLSPAVQQQVERLRQFLGNGDIYVSFNRHELLVKKRSYIRDYLMLLQFAKLAIDLYDQAMLTFQKGIEFVGGAPPPRVEEAVCQICGEAIGAEAVLCRRCRTPHHEECWKYYGACSTYGCRETHYLRPRPKRYARLRRTKSRS
jgi:hypothetical protein